MRSDLKNFVNFKVHTQYSICEGAIKIPELTDYCKTRKISALGISDSYNLCGALEFSQEISKVGTQPIISSQINFKFSDTIGRIPVFAKTETGFKNLIKLSSKSYLDIKENEEPHCLINDLLEHKKDLIILSGGINSLISTLVKNRIKDVEKLINEIKEIFQTFLFRNTKTQRYGRKKFRRNIFKFVWQI